MIKLAEFKFISIHFMTIHSEATHYFILGCHVLPLALVSPLHIQGSGAQGYQLQAGPISEHFKARLFGVHWLKDCKRNF